MGTLKNFAGWMSGNKGGKDTTLSVLTKLKIFNKRLSRQATQLNMKSQRARAKAIDLRKKGDTAGSKMQMRAHLQMQAWKNNIENFQLKLDGLQYKLEQAKAVNDVESILKNVAGVITVLQKTVSAPEISQIISQIDLGISDFDATQEVAAEGMEDMGATDQISDDQEICSVAPMSSIPSAATSCVASKSEIPR